MMVGFSRLGALCCSGETPRSPSESSAALGEGSSAPSTEDAAPPKLVTAPICADRCEVTGDFVKLSNIPYDLDELSGLAVSRRYQGVLYAHNDSGDTARIFAFGTNGAPQGEFKIQNATAFDWEDIGSGPCEDGSPCLFIGDIGDNDLVRTAGTSPPNYAVYVVHEPALSPPGGKATLASEKLPFVYPDGARNAEALLVDPRSADLFLITKSKAGQSAVYQYPKPFRPSQTVTLTKISDLVVPAGGDRQVTGGAIHPCERRVVFRTYTHAFELIAPKALSMGELFKTTPRPLAIPLDLQGEAITYDHAGMGIFTSSEAPLGGAPPLRHANCDVLFGAPDAGSKASTRSAP